MMFSHISNFDGKFILLWFSFYSLNCWKFFHMQRLHSCSHGVMCIICNNACMKIGITTNGTFYQIWRVIENLLVKSNPESPWWHYWPFLKGLVTSRYPSQRANNAELSCVLWPEQCVEQIIELHLICLENYVISHWFCDGWMLATSHYLNQRRPWSQMRMASLCCNLLM